MKVIPEKLLHFRTAEDIENGIKKELQKDGIILRKLFFMKAFEAVAAKEDAGSFFEEADKNNSIIQCRGYEARTSYPQPVVQLKENSTGLPQNLKTGIESVSGVAMDDVKVHYNSDKPADLNALAYAQGTDIHVAPGQEQHLAHEAWHTVQQKQGRVKPKLQMKGFTINDDDGLERESDTMGFRAQNSGRLNVPGLPTDRSILPEISVIKSTGQSNSVKTDLKDRMNTTSVTQLVPREQISSYTDEPYKGKSRYEIDIRDTEAVLTVRLMILSYPGISNEEIDRVQNETRTEFLRYWDRRFNIRDESGKELPLRVQLLYAVNPHAEVKLYPGEGRDEEFNWYVKSPPVARAHELGHLLGMPDEYADAKAPNRATATSPGVKHDNSLMGDFFTEGIGKAKVQQRHGDILAAGISNATATYYSAVPSGIYITREGDTLESIALRLLGSAARWRELYTKNLNVIGSNPDKILEGITLQL